MSSSDTDEDEKKRLQESVCGFQLGIYLCVYIISDWCWVKGLKVAFGTYPIANSVELKSLLNTVYSVTQIYGTFAKGHVHKWWVKWRHLKKSKKQEKMDNFVIS